MSFHAPSFDFLLMTRVVRRIFSIPDQDDPMQTITKWPIPVWFPATTVFIVLSATLVFYGGHKLYKLLTE